MPEPTTPKIGACALCGGAFEIVSNRKTYCNKICKQAGEYVDPPEHAEALEAMSVAFVAAVRADVGYVVEIMAEGSRMRARQVA